MCGIVGCYGSDHRQKTIQSLKVIHHRGPDETVVKSFDDANVSIGVDRLAIQDLRKKIYPFFYRGRHLVYNGEIYNASGLARSIRYKPKTRCDGEIILPLFEKYGTAGFELLTGMFAVAIYDANNQSLILARDKFGEKPLYYQVTNDQILFGSELKIFTTGTSISSQAIFRYLALGYQPFRSTIYNMVYKVQPGEVVIIHFATKKTERRFYSQIQKKIQPFISGNTRDSEVKQATHDLDRTLKIIVKEKIIADVPVGVYLSGGVDSSLLAALVSREMSRSVKTFSVKFDIAEYDESSAAKNVAKHLGSDHTEITVSDTDMRNMWESVIKNLDEPFADPAIFPTYALSLEAKKYVTVIMSGEGADEFFGGYPHYRKYLFAKHLSPFPLWWTKKLLQLLPSQKIAKFIGSPEAFYTSAQYNMFWNSGFSWRNQYISLIRETWSNLDQIKQASSYFTPLNLFLYDLHYYVGEQLCMKIDKMTMLHSVESRAPYLDERLYPFMVLSAKLLMQNYEDKYLLRQVARKYIPSINANKVKHGFSLPLEYWLRKGLLCFVKNALHPHELIQQIIPKERMAFIINGFLENRNNESLTVWNLVILDSWLKEHVRY